MNENFIFEPKLNFNYEIYLNDNKTLLFLQFLEEKNYNEYKFYECIEIQTNKRYIFYSNEKGEYIIETMTIFGDILKYTINYIL